MKTLASVTTFPPRTITGNGTSALLMKEAAVFGDCGVLVHGTSLQQSGALDAILAHSAGLQVRTFCHAGGEPTLKQVDQLVDFLKAGQTQWVAAVGGGSVVDLAKAAAGLRHAPLKAGAYQRGENIPPAEMPFLAVPTTAGTGSEATIVSVLTDSDRDLKKSIRHQTHMARTVILDGDLLRSCPQDVIASSGLDALTQAVESYVSRNATWLTDQLALKAASMIAGNLQAVFDDPSRAAAQSLLEGSYLAGLALSNARLGLVHGLAHPLGARFKQPHGLVCAVCLPPVLRFNRESVGVKYQELSRAVGDDIHNVVNRLMKSFGVENPFAGAAFENHETEAIVAETLASGSTKANPRDVAEDDVRDILDGLTAAT